MSVWKSLWEKAKAAKLLNYIDTYEAYRRQISARVTDRILKYEKYANQLIEHLGKLSLENILRVLEEKNDTSEQENYITLVA